MNDKLLFGTGGTPHSSKSESTADGIERIAELGLGCMEVEFVYGANMSQAMARKVGETARNLDVQLSAHGPYYINLNAHEEEKLIASRKRLMQTARIASTIGARGVIFHPAFYLKDPPDEVYDRVKKELEDIVSAMRSEDIKVTLRTETTGKRTQFGSLEEVLRLSAEVDGVAPCIDFAHLHAREGKSNSYAEFKTVLKQIDDKLGISALNDMHIHLSGIKYSAKGELSHLDLKESNMNYVELLKAWKEFDIKGLVICESPSLESDALIIQEAYNSL
ncbi:MAG: deoxyribonuclease IV [Dehalococcoidia bacterium]|jgi:deoxyribonuclease-4